MINIVMIARNRPNLTRQAVVSLYSHTPPGSFNLTLVDDQSDDLIEVESPNACVLRIGRSNGVVSKIKNLGVYWSEHYFGRGEWLYLSDNDAFFMDGWSEKLVLAIADGQQYKFALVGGQNHPYHQPISGIGVVREYGAVAGTSWLMPWSTWDTYGPLEESGAPGVGQSEDHAFCQKIRADGYKVGAVWPHVVLDTGITQTDGQLSPGHEHKKRVEGVVYE
jgi:hypothetical protein